MSKIWLAVFKKNRQTALYAYPWSFMLSRIFGGVFSVLLPLIIYFFVFNQQVSNEFLVNVKSNNYVSYIVLGQSLNVLCFATLMNVGRSLISEIREGTLDTFLLSPASRIQYFLGTYIEQLGRSCFEYLVVLGIGIIFGFEMDISYVLYYLLFFVISSFVFFCFSILVSTIMLYTRDTYLIQNTIMLVIECICGVAFPIKYLPSIFQIISNFLPVTPILQLFRYCILSNESIFFYPNLLLQTFGLCVLYLAIGYIGFRKIEKKLIEEILA